MPLSVVFFGSGPVALASLKLLKDAFSYEAIITKKSTYRDMQQAFPGVPIFAANTRAELNALCDQQQFTSQIGLLIDYGVIVSQRVIDSFSLGIINSHFSLLPEWRGADPITFAVLSGQQETGVSVMLLTAGLDEGPLLAQQRVAVPPACTTPQLTDILVSLSADMLPGAIAEYAARTVQPQDQRDASLLGAVEPTYSRKLTPLDGLLDWRKPAVVLEREIRAYQPWPRSRTTLAGREVIILDTIVTDDSGVPGTVHVDGKRLVIYCGEQSLEIRRLQPAGKKPMDTAAFLAGYRTLLT